MAPAFPLVEFCGLRALRKKFGGERVAKVLERSDFPVRKLRKNESRKIFSVGQGAENFILTKAAKTFALNDLDESFSRKKKKEPSAKRVLDSKRTTRYRHFEEIYSTFCVFLLTGFSAKLILQLQIRGNVEAPDGLSRDDAFGLTTGPFRVFAT